MLRTATLDDIPAMHAVRLSVRENAIGDPSRVQPDDYRTMLAARGRGWVCDDHGVIVAFGVADAAARNIWALFVRPDFAARGLGRQLLQAMTDWLFEQAPEPIWLTTEPRTRAERFYRAAGWRETGLTDQGELRFELRRVSVPCV
jgi:GNAT superfamily N-acetyltransferase